MTEIAEPVSAWSALPRWARLGIVVLIAVVVALVALVVVRVVTRVPPIPLGSTAAEELRPGSCLAEDGADLAEYTVVACTDEHPQQVFATADLELDPEIYSLVDESLAVFAEEVCDRYLEYRLFLIDELDKNDYETHAIAIPGADAYAAGSTEARCAISPREGGTITGDVYQAMP